MKKAHIILAFFFFCKASMSQQSGLSVYGGWGFTVPHHADMWNYIEHHTWQSDITYFRAFNDKLPDATRLRKGLGLTIVNPGNPEVMGYGIALYPQLHFPLNRKDNTWFILGCGVEYNTQKYTLENYRLSAIGSHINALISLGFTREFKINDKWSLLSRFNWTHYSNGATKAPNLGLNIPTIGISLQHYLNPKPYTQVPVLYDNPQWQFLFNTSIKQLKAGNDFYLVLMLSGEKILTPQKRNFWGFGSDIIYDYSMQDKLFYAGDSSTVASDNLKISIKGTWTVPLERLQISLQAGTYLKNSNFNKEFVFQRLALRYRLSSNIAAAISMRSHFAKADALEFGLMYTLP